MGDNKRVCLLAKYPYTSDTFLRQQVRVLRKNQIACDVFCLRWKNEPRKEMADLMSIYRFPSVSRKLGFLGYILYTLAFGLWSFCNISIRFAFRQYSVVIVHTLPEYLVFVAMIPKLFGVKVVLYARDLTVELLSSRWCKRRMLLHSLAVTMERLCCGFSNHVFVASHGFRDKLVERGVPLEKLTLLLNTADPVIFTDKRERKFDIIDKEARLLYHGTISKRFGIIYAIQAVAALRETVPGSTLHIYGPYDPEYRKFLDVYIEENKLEDAVKFYPSRLLEEIVEIIRECDFGIVPYVDDEFMNLALSTKSFEYIATGLPVVASRLASIQRIFSEEAVIYARPEDPRDFAQQLSLLCKDPRKRRRIVEKALKEYLAVSGDVMAQRFYSVVAGYLYRGGSSYMTMRKTKTKKRVMFAKSAKSGTSGVSEKPDLILKPKNLETLDANPASSGLEAINIPDNSTKGTKKAAKKRSFAQ